MEELRWGRVWDSMGKGGRKDDDKYAEICRGVQSWEPEGVLSTRTETRDGLVPPDN